MATAIQMLLVFMQLFVLRSAGFETIEDIICTQRFKGCSIDYKERTCLEGEVVGCWNPFPYADKHECLQDFYGKGNVCNSKPCQHDGICLPVTNERSGRTFKCECANTGYYGRRCEKRCPRILSNDSNLIPCLQI